MTIGSLARPAFLDAEEVALFERAASRFFASEATPEATAAWRKNKSVGRELWKRAGAAGLLGVSVPAEYGGGGGDFRHEVVLIEAVGHVGAEAFGVTLHNPVLLPYLTAFATEAQKQKWLPDLCSGDLIGAIAMTEPGAGSDLQGMRMSAMRDGGDYVLKGQKTFITNGQLADFILVAAKTDPAAGSKGVSLFCVDVRGGRDGFARGRNLEKIGQEGQDTSELFFDNVRVSADTLLGEVEGRGFFQLMQKLPQERLVIAWQAMAMIERALSETVDYVRSRKMFGQTLLDFQNTQFRLAECKTEATIAKVFVNHCTDLLLKDALDPATASMAKYWVSDLQGKIIDTCLQMFGGYGYMAEYAIGQMYKDSRIHRIYGGANEVMKLLIARTLLDH